MYRYKQVFWISCVGRVPGWWLKSRGGGGGSLLCGGPPFQDFRIYIKWSLGLKHFCAGGVGGNVTFGEHNSSRHIVVSVRHSGPL